MTLMVMNMTAKELIEIVNESKLWALLTEKEKQDVIKHALRSNGLSIAEEDIDFAVGKSI
jgi:hypothetical protein